MLIARRKRGVVETAIASLRLALGDAAIIGLYVPRVGGLATSGTTVLSLDDVRGAGYGPQLASAGAAQPTWNGTAVVFDGTANYLRAANGNLGSITGDHGHCIIGAVTNINNSRHPASTSAGATQSLLTLYSNGATGAFSQTGSAVITAAIPSTVALHSRRTRVATTTTLGTRRGAGAETTTTNADANLTVNRMTLGASPADTPASFAGFAMRAFVVVNGDYTASVVAAVNQFATALGVAV